VIVQTCGWAWTSTDAVQICGSLPTSPICGDSIVQSPETCDLGALNGQEGSTCSINCTIVVVPDPVNVSVCGNGILEQPPAYPNSTEACDLGVLNGQEGSTCSINCTIVVVPDPVNVSVCGNGVLEQPPAYPNSTEMCDLRALNGVNGSTCSSNCSIIVIPDTVNVSVCGNGVLEQPPAFPNSTEVCDLGASNGQEGSTCSSNCSIIVIPDTVNVSVCGNGVLEQPPAYPNSTEMCDLGAENGADGSSCSLNCTIIIISQPPNYYFNSTNSTLAGKDIKHSLYWNSTVGLSGYIFSWSNGEAQGDSSPDLENGTITIMGSGPGAKQNTGFLSPSTNGILSTGLTNPTYAYADDTLYATGTMGRSSWYGGYALNIPAGSTISGIGLKSIAKASSSNGTNTMKYVVSNNGGTSYRCTKFATPDISTTDRITYFGGASNLMGCNWTAASVNNIRVNATSGATSTRIMSLDLIAVNVTYQTPGDVEANKSYTQYTYTESTISPIKNISVTVNAETYSKTGSTAAGNNMPDLWLQAYNGANWIDIGNFGISGMGNFTKYLTNEIISAWQIPANRKIRVLGRYFDANDSISYSKVWVKLESTEQFNNDTWIPFTGAGNWSNVTKSVNAAIGTTIKWCVYANDSNNVWNESSCIMPFSYVLNGTASICGNGILEQPPSFPNSTEKCDDSNLINGDGCNSTCNIENINGTICQYASSASATSEASNALAVYATGAPDAPYGGNCSVWSGPGYSWNPLNWNVKANLTLKYATTVNVYNITVLGDYDMCISGIWIMNSTTGQQRQILNGITNSCTATYDTTNVFMADSVILQTCGWSWASTDAVQICGSLTNASASPVCGNGKVESQEECDDGNNISGDGCSSACKIEAINGTACSYAISAEATSAQLGYNAIYAIGAPNSDSNCGTLASSKIAWQKSVWNSPETITLTFPSMYASNLTVLGDYDLCINRVWLWRDDHWYLAQAGNIDKGIGADCKINYNYTDLNFKTTKVKLETCGWSVAAIDAAKLCGSSESYPKISIVNPTQDKITASSKGSVMLQISTDIPSKCKFNYQKDFNIKNGTNLSTTDGLTHNYTLTKPATGSANIYYKCTSNAGKKTNPYSLEHRIMFENVSIPFIEVCNWYNCSEGAASISMDDGYQPTLGYVQATCENELESNGLRGTYFLAYTNTYNQSDWNIWKNASSKGHEIGGHSETHVCDAEFPLNKTFYVNETQKNIADIIKNIGMPRYELITYAWQCGDYFPEYGGWIAPYYQFARGYNFDQTFPMESKNPQNIWDYMSVNTAGFGDPPPDYFMFADVTENYQDWVNYVYHDTCNNPEIFSYLNNKSIWTDTIGTVSKYIKERQNATVQNITNTSTGVKFDLYTNLNQTIFNKNLTMRIYIGNGTVTDIKINNVTVGFNRFSIGDQPYVKFNVPPKRTNTIEISGLEMNLITAMKKS